MPTIAFSIAFTADNITFIHCHTCICRGGTGESRLANYQGVHVLSKKVIGCIITKLPLITGYKHFTEIIITQGIL